MTEREIFVAALHQQGPHEQQAFLNRACGSDLETRGRIEALLAEHDRLGSFLESPAVGPQRQLKTGSDAVAEAPTVFVDVNETPGSLIGPYKLLEVIGEGGMGTVWMANQIEPIRRRVAVKVVKAGMDSKQVLARFEAERQALALMDHPNIAKVLDAGATLTGRPYFVMELVKGLPLTCFCDERQLSVADRLKIFQHVCHAVQHAHQKGVIHRDLKPTNILVESHDGRPVPKVIDFGLAKAVGAASLTDRSYFTQFGAILGTPLYMAPEQADFGALDIDTRSDVYVLGIILYELLTGTTPIERQRLDSATWDEIRRVIKEEEPQTPSARLSTFLGKATVATLRQTEPGKLGRFIRGDLDWVVMKALAKERDRRYESAGALAADVERFLNQEPVLAGPPTAAYQLRKFAQRKKATLVVTGVVLSFLILLASGIGWAVRDRAAREAQVAKDRQAREAEVARDRAARQAAIDQEAELALKESENLLRQGRYLDAQSAARRAEGILAGGNNDSLRERAKMMLQDVRMVLRLDEIRSRGATEADAAYLQAFREHGIDVDSLTAADAAQRIRARAIRFELAMALDSWTGARTALKRDLASVLAVARIADPDEARLEVRDALQRRNVKKLRELASAPNLSELPKETLALLARALYGINQQQDAVRVLRQAQQKYPEDYWINFDLGWALWHMQDSQREETVRFYTVAMAVRPQDKEVPGHLAKALEEMGRVEEALACYRRAAEIDANDAGRLQILAAALTKHGRAREAWARYRKAVERNPKLIANYLNFGQSLIQQGNLDEAINCFRNVIELEPKNALAHYYLGKALSAQGKRDDAIVSYRQAIELDSKQASAHHSLGVALAEQEKLDEAIDCFQKVIKLDPKHAPAHHNLGVAFSSQGKLDEAIVFYRKAIELDPKHASSHHSLGKTLIRQQKLDDAIVCYRKAVELNPKFAAAHQSLGIALSNQGKFDEAIACFRTAIEFTQNPASVHLDLGIVLARQGKFDEAIVCFRKVIELDATLVMAYHYLGSALGTQGKLEEEIRWYKKAIELDPKYAPSYDSLGSALEKQGRVEEAIHCYRQAIKLNPKQASQYNSLAWLLATCADPKLRDPAQAVAAATKAVELDPQNPHFPSTLGAANFRCGDFKATIAALEKSMELRQGGDSIEWFFLAMAHWQLGEKEKAKTWYDRAVEWMDKHKPNDEELKRFRLEAKELLGLKEKNEQARH